MFQQFIQKIFFSFFFVLTVLVFGANAQICQPAPNGLVSWYRAENNAADAQGVNDGILQFGTLFAPGRAARGFRFDGTNGAVEIPDSPSLKPQTVTVEAWVRFDHLFGSTTGGAPAGFQYILNKKNNRQNDNFEAYSLIKLHTQRFAFSMSNDNGAQTTVVDPTQTVEVNRWYYVAGTFDGATARLYVNGRKVAELPHALPPSYSTRPVFIGSSGESVWNGLMNGVIDEVKIYNRALSDADIQANYSGDNCRAAADVPANLISWHGGDGDARDFAGVNDGVLVNGAGFSVGKVGQAFRFARGSHVRIDSDGIFRGRGEGSIEAWIKPLRLPDGEFRASAIWTESEASRNFTRLGLYYLDSGQVGIYANGSQITALSPAAVPLDTWTHVAGTYKAGETAKLYVNGELVAQSSSPGVTLSSDSGAFLGIGSLQSGAGDDFDFNGDIDEPSVYTRALTPGEIQAVYNAGTAGKRRAVSTNTGANVSVRLRDATALFENAAAAGEAAQTPLETAVLPPLPQSFAHTGLAYDISTTAARSGNIDLCFNLPALAGANFSRLRVLHLENGVWIDRTTQVGSPQLCGRVTSLSPFVIAENLVPTAAAVTIGGRVTAGGAGVLNATVSLTDAAGATRTARTNSFGYYRFENVPAGAIYTLSAQSKRYAFEPSTRVLFVAEALSDIDFTAQQQP